MTQCAKNDIDPQFSNHIQILFQNWGMIFDSIKCIFILFVSKDYCFQTLHDCRKLGMGVIFITYSQLKINTNKVRQVGEKMWGLKLFQEQCEEKQKISLHLWRQRNA